jgi:M6 family metalloprotease-like protein
MKKLFWFLTSILLTVAHASATVPPKQGSVPEHLRPFFEKIRKEYDTGYWARQMSERAKQRADRALDKSSDSVPLDTVNVPILVGRYSNSNNIYAASVFQQELFDGPNPTGTMTQFYLENSYGRMYMTGLVMGWFVLPRTFDYYVHDGGSRNAGLNYGGRDFTIDIIVAADQTVDFSKFVKYVDAEGAHVPQLGVIHSGADAASGADNIWSHRWNIRQRLLDRKSSGTDTIVDVSKIMLSGSYITNDSLNGKPVIIDGDYTIQPELSGSSNTSGSPKPIGVFTHEFGHIFGLPDLYDTDNSSAGLGNWCLMAGGSYGGDGAHEATPAHMSAWCKEKLGWVTPIVVNSYIPQQKIKLVEKYPEIYKFNARGTPGGEYFLVENRQKVGFDQYLINGGLLIFHVDPSVSSNTNENHRMVDLEQADALRQLNTTTGRGDAGDPFPGSTNNRMFHGYSTPDSRDYSLAQSYVGVRKISNSDTVMSADFDIGTRPYININSITLSEAGSNNNNGRVDPAETGTITVNLLNAYPVDLSNAKVTATATSSDVVIDTSSRFVSITGLASTQYVMNAVVAVKPSVPQRSIKFTVNVQSQLETFSKTVDIIIGYPKILLVAMDSLAIENNIGYYQDAISKYGGFLEQGRVGVQSIQGMRFDKRDVIVYFTGRQKFQTLPDSLGDSLRAFLDKGGKLFLSGQNIAEELKARNSYLQDQLLHATWKKNIVFGRNLYGISADKIGGQLPKLVVGGAPGASNQASPDEIAVDTVVAHPSFIWNSQSGTSYGGLWWENPAKGSKLVFWSFGFEAINDSSAGANTQSQAMASVLNWFYGITYTPEFSSRSIVPGSYILNQNYPNPFNPSTQITYGLKKRGQVSLKIFDVLGREVKEAVNSVQEAGWYSVRFDASDLASGVYYYILTSGSFVEAKKMLLLK